MELILEPHPAWMGGGQDDFRVVEYPPNDDVPEMVIVPRFAADSLVYKRYGDGNRYALWAIESPLGIREELAPGTLRQIHRLAAARQRGGIR